MIVKTDRNVIESKIMDSKDFKRVLTDMVQEYIDNFDRFDSNPQLRVNPVTFRVDLVNGSDMMSEIEDSDEAVEDAAASQGMESDDATDYQVKQNPDFYPVKRLLKAEGNTDVPSEAEIDKIVREYFRL